MNEKIVNNVNGINIYIIGSGIAGLAAAKSARSQNPEAKISIITKDNHLPYYRLRLCELIGKEFTYDGFLINSAKWYEDNKIKVIFNETVISLDCPKSIITTESRAFNFDSVVIASGSISAMPPFKNKDLACIHSLWTFEDIDDINSSLKSSKKAVVVGGGLLGLEAAYHISKLGIETNLVEGMKRLLPKQLDEEGSVVFTKKVESLGVKVVTGLSVDSFLDNGVGRVKGAKLSDGSIIDADIVIVSVGVYPNTDLCQDDIVLDKFICVDEKMQTNCNNIYSAGDVSSFEDLWSGQWATANLQGQVAGTNAAGGSAIYVPQITPYSLSTMETRVIVLGDFGVEKISDTDQDKNKYEYLVQSNLEDFSYIKLAFKDSVLCGCILVGSETKKFLKLQSLIKSKTKQSDIVLSDFIESKYSLHDNQYIND